jgi:hypothetical protein
MIIERQPSRATTELSLPQTGFNIRRSPTAILQQKAGLLAEIASFGCMVSPAKTLGYYQVAEILVLTLDKKKRECFINRNC